MELILSNGYAKVLLQMLEIKSDDKLELVFISLDTLECMSETRFFDNKSRVDFSNVLVHNGFIDKVLCILKTMNSYQPKREAPMTLKNYSSQTINLIMCIFDK